MFEFLYVGFFWFFVFFNPPPYKHTRAHTHTNTRIHATHAQSGRAGTAPPIAFYAGGGHARLRWETGMAK